MKGEGLKPKLATSPPLPVQGMRDSPQMKGKEIEI